MKDKFIKYCAEIMGHELDSRSACCNNGLSSYKSKHGSRLYNPYDDLNQMAEVVEKLITKWCCSAYKKHSDKGIKAEVVFANAREMGKRISRGHPIKQAFRDFIISTMDKQNDIS